MLGWSYLTVELSQRTANLFQPVVYENKTIWRDRFLKDMVKFGTSADAHVFMLRLISG